MKKEMLLTVGTVLMAIWALGGGGCEVESAGTNVTSVGSALSADSQEDAIDNSIGIIHVGYAKGYQSLEELVADADLILSGTIGRTEAVPDANTGRSGIPLYNTHAVVHIDKVLKGSYKSEITVVQTGAEGHAKEEGNPPFHTGEQVFLFLRGGEDGLCGLLHPDGRFVIEEDKVSSLNYVLPTGQSRPSHELMFWKVDMSNFVSKVETVLKEQIVIPEEKPVILMDIQRVMGGAFDTLSVYDGGFVLYTKISGMRMAAPGHPPIKEWRTGQFSEQSMKNLAFLIQSEEFTALDNNYEFEPVESQAEDGHTFFTMGDMTCEFMIDYKEVKKMVTASQYISSQERDSYPDMPYPLNDLYTFLRGFGENNTKTQLREELTGNDEIVVEFK